MLDIAYGVYWATFLVAIGFFFRYDIRKKFLPRSLLAIHVGLAVLTFIAFTAALSGYTYVRPRPAYPQRQPMINFHRQQELRRRYHGPP